MSSPDLRDQHIQNPTYVERGSLFNLLYVVINKTSLINIYIEITPTSCIASFHFHSSLFGKGSNKLFLFYFFLIAAEGHQEWLG